MDWVLFFSYSKQTPPPILFEPRPLSPIAAFFCIEQPSFYQVLGSVRENSVYSYPSVEFLATIPMLPLVSGGLIWFFG